MVNHLLQQFYEALLYDNEADYESVIRLLTVELESRPSNGAAFNNRGVAYYELGDSELALMDFRDAYRVSPLNAIPLKNQGRLLHQQGDLSAALAAFDSAVLLAPNDPYLRRTRASARVDREELRGALEDFTHAIASQPSFAQQYLDRAVVYDRLGEHTLAAQDRLEASRLGGSGKIESGL
jgi:tetratricopeptide (TPR) repeat protein